MAPLVLHGFTEDDTVWPALAPGGSGVLLPGHGWRPCPPGTTNDGVADAIAGGWSGARTVIGYSLGGRVALRLAQRHPHRVSRLILISAGPGISDASERAARRRSDERLALVLDHGGLGAFLALWEALPALRPAVAPSRAAMARLRALRLSHDPQGLAACLRCLGQGVVVPDPAPPACPLVLIHGAEDRAYADHANALARSAGNARVIAVAGAGHAVHRDQPAALARVLADHIAGC
jgi:2-succinyl-6-hydroxy-2,4-cyclohexadiene-1-carboxylate synthase